MNAPNTEIPCPPAPKLGYSQYFDRDTWSWIFIQKK